MISMIFKIMREDLENSLVLKCVKHEILPLAGQGAEVLVCLSGK